MNRFLNLPQKRKKNTEGMFSDKKAEVVAASL